MKVLFLFLTVGICEVLPVGGSRLKAIDWIEEHLNCTSFSVSCKLIVTKYKSIPNMSMWIHENLYCIVLNNILR
uniref:Uncharacterized protein n=1 Tax=Strigamia maritima TaxID=126957 RepID=T1JN36_STRMM